MISLLAAAGLASVLVACAIAVAVARVNRWPEPTPRPFACVRCGVDYADPRALGWHMAMHLETYDQAAPRGVEG